MNSGLRIVASVMASVVVWATWPITSYAQVNTDIGGGYCWHDANGNGVMAIDEMPAGEYGVPDNFDPALTVQNLYTINVETVVNGALNSASNNLQGLPTAISNNSGDSHAIFNGMNFDADTGNGFRFDGGRRYTFDISDRCNRTTATRTDTNTVPDPDETSSEAWSNTNVLQMEKITGSNRGTLDYDPNGDSTMLSPDIDVGEVDIAGFEFEGNIVLNMTADVGGHVVFNEADSGGEQAGDVTLTIGAGSLISGAVVLGEREAALNTNAAHDIVMSNAGTITNLDLSDTNNTVLTNTGRIGGPDDGTNENYGLDATDVGTGLTITNDGTGRITNLDASGTNRLTINNQGTARIDSLLLNSNADPVDAANDGADGDADDDVSTTVNNAGSMGILTADRVGQFNFSNTGTISSPVDEAIVLSNSASIDFVNDGTIGASSSDAVNLTNYNGFMTLTNSGVMEASTNNVINANRTSGAAEDPSYLIVNNGTIRNNNNRGISMQNVGGDITIHNASAAQATISTNQTALDFTDDGASDDMDVTVINGAQGTINANFGTAIDADSVSTLAITNSGTISAGVNNAIDASGGGSITLANTGSGASISAGSMTAFNADGATDDVTLTNEGTISAFNQTVNLQNAEGGITITNSGTIRSTHNLADARTNVEENYTISASQASGTPPGGNVSITNASGATISTNSDRAIGVRGFDISGDTVTITNNGTISAGRDMTLDLKNSDNITLTNSGTISAGRNNALDVEAVDDITLTNSGTISAVGNSTLDFSSANDVEITNQAGGTISAGGDYAVFLTGVTGASMVLSNAGTISAGASSVGSNPAAIYGNLGASVNEILITNEASGVITSVGNLAATGGAIFLDADDAEVNITNSGTIRAGVLAASGATAVEASNAIRIENIEANSVRINNDGGRIEATEDRAIYMAGGAGGNITDFTLINTASSVITAEDFVVQLANTAGASAVVENAGTISATDTAATHLLNFDNFSSRISITNSGTISTANDRAIAANVATGGTDTFTLNNTGTISAVDQTVFLESLDTAPIVLNNGANGSITASGTQAISIDNINAAFDFDTGAGSTISATDDVVRLLNVGSNARMDFDNAGTISGTASTADHVLDFNGFGGTLEFNNLSSGTISSAGSNAVLATHTGGGSKSLNFINAGTIRSATANAVIMSGFDDEIDFTNSGTIEVTGGASAVSITGTAGDVMFTNSGRIESSGANTVGFFGITDDGDAATVPTFRNLAGGVIQGANNVLTASGAATQDYTITNHGSIIADTGSYAVFASGVSVNLTTTGVISSAGQTAILVGPGSSLTLSGTVSAGGSSPRAVELQGRGSEIELVDGAIVVGTFYPADQGSYTESEKHTVKLTAVSNASYLYNFDTNFFIFEINDAVQTGASGFSPATSNFQAMTLMHDHHAQHTRNIWREFGRFDGAGGLRSFGFADDLDNARSTDRSFKLSGDRSGFAQSLQQSIFGLFDAEVMLVSSNASYELDDKIFTFDQSYQGAGFGFSDVLALGPFSLSTMVLAGVAETDMSRLVFTNTNSTGSFTMKSSYDSTLLDVVYEALFDMTIYGNQRRLTRRKPYRINLEIGLGGSLHSEDNDGFAEQTHMETDGSNFQSNAFGGRVKLELQTRNPFTRQMATSFIEYESITSEITDGNRFTYSASGANGSHLVGVEQLVGNSLSLGINYQVEADIDVNFSYTSTSRDNESDETSAKLAVKWVF